MNYRIMFQVRFMTSKTLLKRLQSVQCPRLRVEVNVKVQLSASSRRPEDVKMLSVALFTKRGR